MSDRSLPKAGPTPPPQIPLPSPPPPAPPAPPLPPQRYVNRAAHALSRFAQPFIGGSRPPTAQNARFTDGEGVGRRVSAAAPRLSGPLSSQTAGYEVGFPVVAVDISPQRTHAVLAGRDVLRTIRVSGAECTDEFDIRAAVLTRAAAQGIGGSNLAFQQRDDLGATDVKWSHGNFDSTIATAAANGKIVLFDLNRPDVQLARLHEHNRQVHKLAFNPHQGYYLLSASQDGTIRFWDLRTSASVKSIGANRSLRRYRGNADGIRDVKWSPTDGTEFACATDAGVVQRWDFLKENAPTLKINAHRKACMSIDWHPDGKHLASAGLDKTVQIWDFASGDRRQRPACSFRAPQEVSKVAWRPVEWHSSSETGHGSWQTCQVATAYKSREPRVHVWDLNRPSIPFREIDRLNTPPSDILWHSEDLLWTVGPASSFTQTDLHFVPRPEERRDLQAFDVAPDGQVISFLRPRSIPLATTVDSHNDIHQEHVRQGSVEKLSGDRHSESRSATDDESPSNFLTSSFKRRTTTGWSNKNLKVLGNTPPENRHGFVLNLDETLQQKRFGGNFSSTQAGISGYFPGVFDARVFKYLAIHQIIDFAEISASDGLRSLNERAEKALLTNARHALQVKAIRLAKTWDIVSFALQRELQVRGQVQRALRLRKQEYLKMLAAKREKQRREAASPPLSARYKSQVSHERLEWLHPDWKAYMQTQAVSNNGSKEGPSNFSTPLTRPSSVMSNDYVLSSPLAEDKLTLTPPASAGGAGSGPTEGNGGSKGRTYSSGMDASKTFIKTPDWYNAAPEVIERRRMMGSQPPAQNATSFDASTDRAGNVSPESQIHRTDFQENRPSIISSLEKQTEAKGSPRSNAEQASQTSGRTSQSKRVSMVEDGSQSQRSDIVSSRSATPSSKPDTASKRFSGLDEWKKHFDDHLDELEKELGEMEVSSKDEIEIPPTLELPDISSLPETEEPFIDADFSMPPALHKLMIDLGPKPPFRIQEMLPQLIDYYTSEQCNVMVPAALILLLQPLVVRKAHEMPQSQVAAILGHYHEQLLSHELYVPAAHLRKLLHPDVSYRRIWEPFLAETSVSLLCSNCGARLDSVDRRNGPNTGSMFCEKCSTLLDGCTVCWGRKGGGLWAWCQACGHGGHDICLSQWWATPRSQGTCAAEGCLHDCVPGQRRERRAEALAKDQAQARARSSSAVRRDDWIAGESRAVERVRSGYLNPGRTAGVSATTLGGKRVKVVTPSEQGLNG